MEYMGSKRQINVCNDEYIVRYMASTWEKRFILCWINRESETVVGRNN